MEAIVTDITKEELSGLLNVATYGSSWLECHVLRDETSLDTQEDFDCREDLWAHRLQNGGHLACYDHNDVDEDGYPKEYLLSMKDFYNGISLSLNKRPSALGNVLNGEGDYYDADAVMQVILFGEVIYG